MNRSVELRAIAKTILFVLALVLLAAAQASAQSTTVIVVRHAERADGGGMNASRDPELSDAGKARAAALRDALADAGVSAIYSTEFQRTRMTGMPLAEKLGIQPTVVNANVPLAQLASKIRAEQAGKTALVVGHSNTIGPIVKALGGPDMGDVPDAEYDNMYVVIIDSTNVKVVKSKYGPR